MAVVGLYTLPACVHRLCQAGACQHMQPRALPLECRCKWTSCDASYVLPCLSHHPAALLICATPLFTTPCSPPLAHHPSFTIPCPPLVHHPLFTIPHSCHLPGSILPLLSMPPAWSVPSLLSMPSPSFHHPVVPRE